MASVTCASPFLERFTRDTTAYLPLASLWRAEFAFRRRQQAHRGLPERIPAAPQPNNNGRGLHRIRRRPIRANAHGSSRPMDAVQEVVQPSDENGKKDRL